jgi:hypothetical protein
MNKNLQKMTLLGGVLISLLTSGCFDTAEDFTINPDGSGKVVHECSFQPVDFGNEKKEPEAALRSAVRELLKESQGVEVWRDVSFKVLDDGRFFFRGTAYFKDLSKLEIPNQSMLEFNWKKNADGTAILDLRTNKATSSHDGLTITKKAPPASTKPLSPEALAKKIKKERAQFQQSKPMLSGFLGAMKQSTVFHLPGEVEGNSNFTKDSSGALAIKFDGATFVETMEKLVNDDEWCRRHNGTSFDNMEEQPMMDDELAGLIFGTKGPVQATVNSGTAPLFDFAAEVAAAKTESAKVEKELGVSGATIAPPAQGQPLRKVEVVGTRFVTSSDSEHDLRPFHEEAGCTLAMLIEFPGSILSLTDKTVLETAMADDGSSLLPDENFDRTIRSPTLSADKAKAILEIKLKPPGKNLKGFKEISGHVQYTVSGGIKEVDLGVEELKAGAKGTALGVSIGSIKEGWQKDGSQDMELNLDVQPSAIKSLAMVVDGNKTVLSQNGYFGGGDSYTFTYASKRAFPAKARLVAEVYDKLQTFEVPFKLENISLLGTK